MGIKIGLCGYGGSGKDTAGAVLCTVIPGMGRVSLGDFIKRDVEDVVYRYTGIDVWDCTDEQKEAIRSFLVEAGNRKFHTYLYHLMAEVGKHPHVVNTRIFRLEEYQAWIDAGGIIVEVTRPGNLPKEPQEHQNLELARQHGLIQHVLINDGDLESFKVKVARWGKELYETWKRDSSILTSYGRYAG